jgi:hypothetical protein
MKKAIYQNPKTGKFYALVDNEETKKIDLFTVYDNAKVLEKAEIKVDKKGRAYRVAEVEFRTTKAGHQVLGTVVPEK